MLVHALMIRVAHPCSIKVTKFEVLPSYLSACVSGGLFLLFSVDADFLDPLSIRDNFGQRGPKLFPDDKLVIRRRRIQRSSSEGRTFLD